MNNFSDFPPLDESPRERTTEPQKVYENLEDALYDPASEVYVWCEPVSSNAFNSASDCVGIGISLYASSVTENPRDRICVAENFSATFYEQDDCENGRGTSFLESLEYCVEQGMSYPLKADGLCTLDAVTYINKNQRRYGTDR